MTLYLHARVGPYRLLLPALRVLEAWTPTGDIVPGHWRGHRLPFVDLRLALGVAAGAEATHLAYGAAPDDADTAVLALDGIIGLVTLGDEGLAALPAISPEAADLFDAVTRAPIAGHHVLRLRNQPEFTARHGAL